LADKILHIFLLYVGFLFINVELYNIMKITKIAANPDQNERKLNKLERSFDTLERDFKKTSKELRSDIRDIKRELKGVQQILKDLNIGKRLFFQHKTVFNTLQRKMEKLEAVESEWKKYKESLDKKIKKVIEKQDRSRVKI